ncbi:hypothetical protein [Treponema sp. R80B11-R83G3]
MANKNIQTAKTPQIATGIRHTQTTAPRQGAFHGQMRHGERSNKIPTYEKMLQAEGNTQHATRNYINYVKIVSTTQTA